MGDSRFEPLSLDTVDKRILAALEEAGSNALVSLGNSVRKSDNIEELRRISDSLQRLVRRGLIYLARARDPSHRWIALPADECGHALDLPQNVSWSSEHGYWWWDDSKPRVSVVLTGRGLEEARRVLKTEGWPT